MNQTEILKYLEGQKTTRTITDLIVHCTATKPGAKVNVDIIDGWHKERGFKKQPQSGRICGYHFVVLPDGTIETGRYLSEIGAHVSGQNSRSIGICYVGGLDANGKAADTRTPEQKEALIWLLSRLVVMFPDATTCYNPRFITFLWLRTQPPIFGSPGSCLQRQFPGS